MHRLANPTRFLRLCDLLQPWIRTIAVMCFGSGIYFSLFASPPDYQQSESVRIMYVHVPAAWLAMACYGVMALASAVALIWRHLMAHLIAKATAPIGATFTFLALVTGSLWGKPMWGTWWVWDARLTSVLILFFLYLGYISLQEAFDDPSRGAKASSILAIAGAINLPVIKFSVDWWNTLHQPASILKVDGPSIHSSMLFPLLLMASAYFFFYFWVLLIRVRAEVNKNKIRAFAMRQVER
ncbi:MAG: heme ABC transporter permease [Pseudomonadota bacterium]|nr:heme ABC transporter permease [Pseudomonadota bacterium]